MLYNVPKNLRLTSLIPSISNFKLSHGLELYIIYHLVESGPNSFIVLKGFIVFPIRFDIFCPFLSKTRPLEITFLYEIELNINEEIT